MSEQETREKIIKIIAPYVSAYGDDERIANALIAVGIGDVESLEISDADKEQSSVNYYCEMREWKDKCKEAEHRAERAERALMTVCTNVIKDEEDDLAIEPRARVLYKAYLKQAEKELTEEKKDG